MSMTDPIADMLTRIRNANAIRRKIVDVPRSKLKKGIAEVLKREGYIRDYLDIEAGPASVLRLELNYGPDGRRVLRDIQRVSKPGRRVYRAVDELESPVNGIGVFVVSTDRGVLSDREAREQRAGGEVLCKVY
jgi:small subunit ribosomal protein S8